MAAIAPAPPVGSLVYAGPYPDLFELLPREQQQELLEIFAMLDELSEGLSIAIGNLKGGVAKSTSAIYLALMLALKGDSVLVVDGDATNKTIVLWSTATVEWPAHAKVVAWSGRAEQSTKTIDGKEMARLVQTNASRFRHRIIDTGPQMKEYLAAALRVTTDFIVCTSPSQVDMLQINASVNLAAEVEAVTGGPLYVTVLVARAKQNTNILKDAFVQMDEEGQSYFGQAIIDRVSYQTSFGTVPADFGDYVKVLRQLVEEKLTEEV